MVVVPPPLKCGQERRQADMYNFQSRPLAAAADGIESDNKSHAHFPKKTLAETGNTERGKEYHS
jgi:hypothetical protein